MTAKSHVSTVTDTFVIRLRPRPGVDPIRALRRRLKIPNRYCGLRAVTVEIE
jgi:hypothetical protein